VLESMRPDWESVYKTDLNEIRAGVQRVMGADCKTEFECVDKILSAPSGKYRYTISHVKTPLENIHGIEL
ncbi:MAG: hypothetical protein KJO26_14230, partial [Deltaproteobacteria bacterium]|nr:hypothetical protein [Deltaproteobacteria bacterium]